MQLEADQRHLNAQAMVDMGAFFNEPHKQVNVASEWGYLRLKAHRNRHEKGSVPCDRVPFNTVSAEALTMTLTYADT